MQFIKRNTWTSLSLVVALICVLQAIPGVKANFVYDFIKEEALLICKATHSQQCALAINFLMDAAQKLCHHDSKLFDPSIFALTEA